ncbi:MAG TPA: flagellar hook capping FlgD N-terminal domain-containing protein [Xanthobacteraceae bacterium]|nr:flagellar hook capping FlgD N-terminal domain-containing protein [Xanthobacteraceae bacterium]
MTTTTDIVNAATNLTNSNSAQAAAAANATTNSTSSTAQAAGSASTQQLAGNFNTFLTLLTTQLQNQDPLDPLDTNQFTQQLVEFASVEQQVNMNTNMQTMISLQQATEATSALQFLGKTVTVNGSTATLSNATSSPATWTFSSPSPATGTVTIASSTGQTAYSGTVSLQAGSQSFGWNGQGSNGVTWPDGQYTMTINATSATGQSVSISTQVQGVVSGINVSQNPPQLIVGGQSVPISSIQSISG